VKDLRDEIEETKEKWAVIEVLFQSSAGAVAGAVESEGLLNHPQFGPAIAAMYVEQTPGARENVIAKLRAVLTDRDDISDRSVSDLDRKRSAASALRNLGGADSAEALFVGLVGPEQERAAPAAGPFVGPGMPPAAARGARGPMGPPRGMPTGPTSARGGTGGTQRTAMLPAAPYIARALGTMGQADLLRAALGASGGMFYRRNALEVQTAALEGIAFLPGDADPLKMLQDLLRLATTKALKQATADAIAMALSRTSA
jgi:hypothetical protein